MSQFQIVNESTEDTLEVTDNLPDAIRSARDFAKQGRANDPVTILESGGKAVRQFVRMADGTVAEQAIARPVKPSGGEAKPVRTELVATPDPARS